MYKRKIQVAFYRLVLLAHRFLRLVYPWILALSAIAQVFFLLPLEIYRNWDDKLEVLNFLCLLTAHVIIMLVTALFLLDRDILGWYVDWVVAKEEAALKKKHS